MKTIICTINAFDLMQPIVIADLESQETTFSTSAKIADLPEVVSALCNDNQIKNVCLIGYYGHCNTIKQDILAYSKTHYSENNIEIEVRQ